MAGIVSPSMPVFIVSNEQYGNTAYATMNEGLGKVLRYGAYGAGDHRRLKWMEETLYPVLRKAHCEAGKAGPQEHHRPSPAHGRRGPQPQPRGHIVALPAARPGNRPDGAGRGAGRQGPGVHQRQRPLLPESLDGRVESDAGCRARHAAEQRRGGHGAQRHGFRNSARRHRREVVHRTRRRARRAVLPRNFSRKDANPDIGDSAITETNGLGGFAIAASPAIVQFVGGAAADALRYTRQMYEITAAENQRLSDSRPEFPRHADRHRRLGK